MHRCGGCGSLFDQDRNAARNILRRGLLMDQSDVHVPEAAMAAV